MKVVKRLVFVPWIFILVVISVVLINSLLQDPIGSLFSLDFGMLKTYFYLSACLMVSALLFGMVVAICASWEIPLVAAAIIGLIPLMMLDQTPTNFILGGGFFISFIIEMMIVLQKMKSYITFSPGQIFGPVINWTSLILAISIAFTFYFAAQTKIEKEGFTVPESLIDLTVSLSGIENSLGGSAAPALPAVKGESTSSLSISQEQIDLIKKNPQLLKQFNITEDQFDEAISSFNQKPNSAKSPTTSPSIGSQLNQKKGPTSAISDSSFVKDLIKSQLDTMLKPYISFMAPLIAFLAFSAIASANFVLGLFIPLLLWLIFLILEKTGFIHFEKEMREIRKLVV